MEKFSYSDLSTDSPAAAGWRYGMTLRPYGFATGPKGATATGAGCARHGWVEFAEPLSADDLRRWEMVPVAEGSKAHAEDAILAYGARFAWFPIFEYLKSLGPSALAEAREICRETGGEYAEAVRILGEWQAARENSRLQSFYAGGPW